jgi:hypothetical protein
MTVDITTADITVTSAGGVNTLLIDGNHFTISMFRQLDTVMFDEMDPLGRLNITTQDKGNATDVVGVSGNQMVRSTEVLSRCVIDSDTVKQRITGCSHVRIWESAERTLHGLWWNGTLVLVSSTMLRIDKGLQCGEGCQGVGHAANERDTEEIDEEVDIWRRLAGWYQQASELPLIVLAGS